MHAGPSVELEPKAFHLGTLWYYFWAKMLFLSGHAIGSHLATNGDAKPLLSGGGGGITRCMWLVDIAWRTVTRNNSQLKSVHANGQSQRKMARQRREGTAKRALRTDKAQRYTDMWLRGQVTVWRDSRRQQLTNEGPRYTLWSFKPSVHAAVVSYTNAANDNIKIVELVTDHGLLHCQSWVRKQSHKRVLQLWSEYFHRT